MFVHFTELAEHKSLPTLQELEAIALKLYRAYATSRGYERAMHAQSGYDAKTSQSNPSTSMPKKPLSSWEATVPLGRPWVPSPGSAPEIPLAEGINSVRPTAGPSHTSSKHAGQPLPPMAQNPDHLDGDRVLGQSIVFIRDAIRLCEFVYATAEGDVGRVYEVLKVRVPSRAN